MGWRIRILLGAVAFVLVGAGIWWKYSRAPEPVPQRRLKMWGVELDAPEPRRQALTTAEIKTFNDAGIETKDIRHFLAIQALTGLSMDEVIEMKPEGTSWVKFRTQVTKSEFQKRANKHPWKKGSAKKDQ